MEAETGIRVFVGHSWEDRHLAESVAAILAENGLEPILDCETVLGMSPLDQAREAIRQVDVYMPLMTMESTRRCWIDQDIGYAAGLNVPVLPVIFEVLPAGLKETMSVLEADRENLGSLEKHLTREKIEAYIHSKAETPPCAKVTRPFRRNRDLKPEASILVFVGHSDDNEDRHLAESVAAILAENGLEPMLECEVILGIGPLDQAKEAIRQVDIYMPLITEQSTRRPWLDQSIGYATALNVPVLPVAFGMLFNGLAQRMAILEADRKNLGSLKKRLTREKIEAYIRSRLEVPQRPEITPPHSSPEPFDSGSQSRPDFECFVFISAKSEDYTHARQVYEFLKLQGTGVFLSDESLPDLGSSDYRKEIDRALDKADHMIVIASSREHVEATWVEAEWGFFINEKRSGRKNGNIITMVTGDLLPQDLPPSLRYYEVLTFEPGSFERLLRYISGNA